MDKKGKIALISALVLVGILLFSVALAKPGERAAKACNDRIDNDGDGYMDFPSDPGCSSKNDDSELDLSVECDDGSDNDGDGETDYNDGGCTGPTDNDETNCGDGVCEGGETSGSCPADCGTPDSCNDTDGGNEIETFGTTSGYLNNSPYSNDDYCVDSGSIMEYYCSGDHEQSSQQSCGTDSYGSNYCKGDNVTRDLTDYYCSTGECDSQIISELVEDCDASDGYGSNYCVNESVYKDFNDYFCSGSSCEYNATPELVESCSYGCENGACNPAPVDTCYDTDGGFVEFVQGTVYGNSSGSSYSYTDSCNGTYVNEWYCSGTQPYAYNMDCTGNYTGCSNGACY